MRNAIDMTMPPRFAAPLAIICLAITCLPAAAPAQEPSAGALAAARDMLAVKGGAMV